MLFIFFNFHYTRHLDTIKQTLPFREETVPSPLGQGIYLFGDHSTTNITMDFTMDAKIQLLYHPIPINRKE